ncbi:MAG: acetyl-CoA synthetase [Myxococcota bacterium]
MSASRRPCLIGVAQRTVHPEEGPAPEPLDLWEELTRAAAADSGGHDVAEAIDDVNVVYSLSWVYDDAPGRLAERLGLGPGGRRTSTMSGASAQKMLTSAAARIAQGECDLALVAGAESLATRRAMRKAGESPDWSHPCAGKPNPPFDDPFHRTEIVHQVMQAYVTFALFDVARRAHLGIAPAEYLQQNGELFAPMTEVAAHNPNAWFRQVRTVDELTRVTADNRMVAHPYPKNLVAIMDIDMGSALLLASEEKADALGVPRDRRVYLRGWCNTKDVPRVAERRDLFRSAGMEEAARVALAGAGVGFDDIGHLDLYSCFPSSVNFARDALGMRSEDGRVVTVTGGLPYHGGPGSNYLGHSIATLVERLREDPDTYGLATGVGMHMVNHSYAVYSGRPGEIEIPNEAAAQERTAAAEECVIRDAATGPARVATYSVVHGREGRRFGVAVCDLPDGERCYAQTESQDLMEEMEAAEWVGSEIELEDGGEGINRIAG